MKNLNRALLLFALALLAAGAFFIGGFANSLRSPETSDDMSIFAKCLTEKGTVMYGAYWCPHCQNEKKAFGDSFEFVNYVECTEETQRCLQEKIESYPTWIFSGDKRLVGEQGIEKLSTETGCVAPK